MNATGDIGVSLGAKEARLQAVVAYDDRWVSGGVGRFAQEVVHRLRHCGLRMVGLGVRARIASPASPLALSRCISHCGADVFWSPGFMPPLRSSVPAVVTIHDLIHRRYGGLERRLYYDAVIRPLVRRVAGIVTVSQRSRDDIVEWLGPRHPPIRVVGSAASSVFVHGGSKLQLTAPYVLYSGNHRTHKNLPRLVEAFARAPDCSGLLLAMTGDPDKSVDAVARKHGISNRLHWLGHLNEKGLAEAYRGATALLMVSLAEGFGLPVVEAMACGTPVVCSATTSLGEIAGDAACLVDPTDVGSIAAGIERVITNTALRQTLSERGFTRAATFSWDDVASRVFALLTETAIK